MIGGRADLSLCALAAGALHAALLLCPGLGGATVPARVELSSGNISVEVSLADPQPAVALDQPAPLNIPEPERPRPPEPVREAEPPSPDPDWPDELSASPQAAQVPIEVPATPQALLEPPPRPASASRGTSGNMAAGLARHYVEHPDEGRRRVREATVRLRLRILASGQIERIEVLESSGHADLDAAAVKGVRRATVVPALHDGKPIDSDLELAVQFRERGKARP